MLEIAVTGLWPESAWLFSALEVEEVVVVVASPPRDRLLVESLLQKAWPPAGSVSEPRPPSSSVVVVVEILLQSGRSLVCPSFSSSSLSSSLSQKSEVREGGASPQGTASLSL